MIPQTFIDDLLTRVDVVDVVDSYVPLKRSGSNLSARCPFHNEKTPSFTVSQSKQFYHCFGCGAHGTAISFLMEYEHMGFVEAVEELAHMAGLHGAAHVERHFAPARLAFGLFRFAHSWSVSNSILSANAEMPLR